MNNSLLKPRRWLAVLALLCSTAALWADEVTDMVILGQTGTKVEGQNYYVFNNITSGQIRWYPSTRTLELENVKVTSSSTETFISFLNSNASLTIKLIGKNSFKYNSKKYAKPVISLRCDCTIESKDFDNPGQLDIYTYGHTSETPAVVWLNNASYMELHHCFAIRCCTFNVWTSGTYSNPDMYDYSVFGAPSSSYIRVKTTDATMSLHSYGAEVLGPRAWVDLSNKDCVYSKYTDVVDGKFVDTYNSTAKVTVVDIGYPLVFGHYDSMTGKYINHRSRTTYSNICYFNTGGILKYDEVTKEVTLNGGTIQGDMIWYGKGDLVINVKGDQLTTIEGLSRHCLRAEYGNIRIIGDHVSNYQGLRLTQSDNAHLDYAVNIPVGKGLYLEHNAKVAIDNVRVGLACTDPEVVYTEEGWNFDYDQQLNSVLSITNSALDIDTRAIAVYGIQNLQLDGCRLAIPENNDYRLVGYIEDNSWYDEFGEFWNPEYWFYPYTICDPSLQPLSHIKWERTGDFGLFIAGTEVTLDNMYDLNHPDDGSTEVRGVTFDDETYTLTLDNAYIRTRSLGDCGIKFSNEEMDHNIVLIGDNHIDCQSYIGIMSVFQPLTIMAANGETMPSLRINSCYGGIQGVKESSVSIWGCNLDVTTTDNPAIGGFYNPIGGVTEPENSELIIGYSNVRMARRDSGPVAAYLSYVSLEGCSILSPANASFDRSLNGIATGGSLVEGEVLIGTNIIFEDSNVETVCVNNWDTNQDGGINIFEAAAVTSVGLVFKGNTSITKFPEFQYFTGISELDEKAFYNCTNLKTLKLPKSILYYNSQCFARSGLTNIFFPKAEGHVYLNKENFLQCADLSEVGFEEGIELSLGTGVFSNCSSLQFIELPLSVTSIPMRCFYNCSELYYFTCDNLKYIGVSAFANTAVYPEFLPEGLEEIDDYAFDGCYGESVYLPKSLRKVGREAMKGFMYIEIPIGSKLEEVGDRAFYGSGFWELTLPPSLHTIGDEAFSSGPDEYELNITVDRKTPAEIGMACFGQLSEDSHIYVPAGCVAAYKNAWPEYEEYIVGGELSEPTAVTTAKAEEVKGDIYNLRGQLLRRNATTEGLPAGIYVVNGKKVIVK
ncbi:MAG: leucine-rich repeat domain-containing protein [Prevotella sp.]|nr:leucine-rich repeat domain-containing protein [Prevotella sp.]